jgi:hypothetical protein
MLDRRSLVALKSHKHITRNISTGQTKITRRRPAAGLKGSTVNRLFSYGYALPQRRHSGATKVPQSGCRRGVT